LWFESRSFYLKNIGNCYVVAGFWSSERNYSYSPGKMGTTDAEGEVLEVLALDPSGIDEGNFELLACSPRLRGGFVYVNFQPYILTDFEDREDKDGTFAECAEDLSSHLLAIFDYLK